MADSSEFDDKEKLNVLLKSAFEVTSTNESTPWYDETTVPFNNYIEGNTILIDDIPSNPDFNTVGNPSDYGLNYSDFYGGNDSNNSFGDGNIEIDSTGVLVRFKKLILEPTGDHNRSYYKMGTINDVSVNLLADSFQFTKNLQGTSKPFEYIVHKNDNTGTNKISKDSTGGNYFFDFKSGIVFFPDYDLVQSFVNNSTPPLFTFVRYIGKKGVANLSSDSLKENSSTTGTTIPAGTKIVISKSDLSNLTKTTASSSGYPVYKLNSGLINSELVFRTTTNETYSDNNGTGIKGYAHAHFNPHIRINNSSQTFTVKITINVPNYNSSERAKFYAGTMGRTFALDYIGTGEYISNDSQTTYNYNLASSVVGPNGVVSYTSTTGDFNPIGTPGDGTGVNEKFDPNSEMIFITFLPNYPYKVSSNPNVYEDGRYNQITYIESIEIESNQDMILFPREYGETTSLNQDLTFNLENFDEKTYREAMRLSQNGYLGIGTDNPGTKLHIKSDGAMFRLEGTNYCYMEFYPDEGQGRKGYFGYPGSYVNAIYLTTQSADRPLILQNDGGNVGIGTTEPKAKLDVIGDLYVRKPAVWQNGNNHTEAGNIFLDCNLSSSGITNGLIWHAGSFRDDYATKTAAKIVFKPEGSGFSGGLDFYTNDFTDTNSATLKMRIKGNGKVGIGTDDPSLPLTVHADGDDVGMLLRLINSNVSDREVRIGCNGGYTRFWTDATHGYLFENGSVISRNGKISSYHTESDLILCTNHATQERMRISRTTGYVGIGTDDPQAKLHVQGGSVHIYNNIPTSSQESEMTGQAGSANLYFDCNNGSGGDKNGIIWKTKYDKVGGNTYTKTSAGIYFQPEESYFRGGLGFYTNNSASLSDNHIERMRINNDGYVGIGTYDPSKVLHIYNNTIDFDRSTIVIESQYSGASVYHPYPGISLRTGNSSCSISRSPSTGNLNIQSYDGDVFINSNVGIGTSSPSEKLDVDGNININGYLKRNSLNKGVLIAEAITGTTSVNKHCPIFMFDGYTNPTDTTIEQMTGIGIAYAGDSSVTGLTGLPTLSDTSDSGFGIYFANYGTINSFISCGKYVAGNVPGSSFLMGKLGIGTNNPQNKLTIYGSNTQSNYDNKLLLSINHHLSDQSWIGIGLGGRYGAASIKSAILFQRKANYGRGSLHFCTNNGENDNNVSLTDSRMTIDRNGHVGIGTNSPLHKLEISDGLDYPYSSSAHHASNALAILNLNTSTWASAIKIVGSHSHSVGIYDAYCTKSNSWSNNTGSTFNRWTHFSMYGDLYFRHYYNSSSTSNNREVLVLKHNGNVGIGTTSPNDTLEIKSNVGSVNSFSIGSRSGYAAGMIGFGYKWTNPYNTSVNLNKIKISPNPGGSNNYYSPCGIMMGYWSSEAVNTFYTAIGFVLGDNNDNSAEPKDKTKMIITRPGNVGIGTTYPKAKLHISGTGGVSSFGSRDVYTIYHANSTMQSHKDDDFYVSNSYWSLLVDDWSWFQDNVYFSSDKRIKQNISDISDNVSLKQLRDISCVSYYYKDKLMKGSEQTIGFIAQQVNSVMPNAINITKGIISNEMRLASDISWNVILYDDSNNIVSERMYDNSGNNIRLEKYKLTINDLNDNSGNTLYRFYVSNDISGNDECKKEIRSLIDEPKSFIFDQYWNNIYIYGKEVNDFHTLDKNKLYALNFSATQEIDRIQQQEKTKLEEAQNKIISLENELASVKSELAKIKQHLGL